MFNWFYLNENNCFPKYIDWFFAKFNWITFFMIVILDIQWKKNPKFLKLFVKFFFQCYVNFSIIIYDFRPLDLFHRSSNLHCFCCWFNFAKNIVTIYGQQYYYRYHMWWWFWNIKSVCLFCLFINLPTWMIFFLLVIIRWFSSYMIKEKHSTSASVLSRIFFLKI